MVDWKEKRRLPMKRPISLLLALLLLLTGCAAGPEPSLSDMLGTHDESGYTSAFGFVIDTAGLHVYSQEDLAALNQVSEFTSEALAPQIENGNAVSIFAAASDTASSVTLSIFPSEGLPGGIETAAEYAEYGLSVMGDKLASAGYTDVQLQLVDVQLDDGAHPAVLCSAQITVGVPYHLLQICFQKGDWMGGLSLSSLESEEALRQLLTRITPNN